MCAAVSDIPLLNVKNLLRDAKAQQLVLIDNKKTLDERIRTRCAPVDVETSQRGIAEFIGNVAHLVAYDRLLAATLSKDADIRLVRQAAAVGGGVAGGAGVGWLVSVIPAAAKGAKLAAPAGAMFGPPGIAAAAVLGAVIVGTITWLIACKTTDVLSPEDVRKSMSDLRQQIDKLVRTAGVVVLQLQDNINICVSRFYLYRTVDLAPMNACFPPWRPASPPTVDLPKMLPPCRLQLHFKEVLPSALGDGEHLCLICRDRMSALQAPFHGCAHCTYIAHRHCGSEWIGTRAVGEDATCPLCRANLLMPVTDAALDCALVKDAPVNPGVADPRECMHLFATPTRIAHARAR